VTIGDVVANGRPLADAIASRSSYDMALFTLLTIDHLLAVMPSMELQLANDLGWRDAVRR